MLKSPIIIRRVVGHSMEPTLRQGRIVFATPLLSIGKGDVVVARHEGREIIKRVIEIEQNGYFLQGDNLDHSRDSRRFGAVEESAILGRVIGV